MGGAKSPNKRKRHPDDAVADSTPSSTANGDGMRPSQFKGNGSVERSSSNGVSSTPAEPKVEGDWQKVKRKKQNYPELAYSDLHRLQSSVKLGDLQNLVLYCLADGTSPQWVSVRHHAMVRKAVVLCVPGLEKDMFKGLILPKKSAPTPSSDSDVSNKEGETARPRSAPVTDGAPLTQVLNNAHANRVHSHKASPDDYVPFKLDALDVHAALKPLSAAFSHVWPIRSPGDDRTNKVHSPLQAMLQSPIPKNKLEKQAEKTGKGPKAANEPEHWTNVRTPVTSFLLSAEEQLENDYVLHPVQWQAGGLGVEVELERRQRDRQSAAHGWVDSRVSSLDADNVPESDIESGSVTMGRNVLALDCEMCTVQGGHSALTRITLLNWAGEKVIDELVKPDLPIIDYLTQYSGITPEQLANVTTRLEDIQSKLLQILTPQTVLLGHSLSFDLAALKMTHPVIVDTSVLYPHPRGPPMRSSLKWLTQKYLSREIQKGHGSSGHDSVEDAQACLDLVKLKCEKGPQWGTHEATVEPIFKRLKRPPSQASTSGQGKKGAIVDRGAPERNFGQMADYCIGCSSDADVVEGVKRAVLGDPDGAYIPGGGADFTWARFRELERIRGWRNDIQSSATTNGAAEPSMVDAVAQTVSYIMDIYSALPACTMLIVYSGTGDPREMAQLHERHRQFQREFRTKKWDEIKDKWTDREEQALKAACSQARAGMGLLCIK